MSSLIGIALLLTIIGVAYSTGRIVLRLLRDNTSGIELGIFAIAGGMGFLSFVVFAAGLLAPLKVLPLLFAALVLLSIVVLFLLPGARFSKPRLPKPESPLEWVCVTAIFLSLGASFIGALAPPVGLEWDALSYHLAAPKLYLAAGRIVYIPFIHQSNFPFMLQMLYLLCLSIGSVAGAKLCHWFCAVLLIVSIVCFASRHITPVETGRKVGLIAAALVATIPIFFWEASVAYVDLATALFTWLSLYALFNYRKRPEQPVASSGNNYWLVISAIMMGNALGTKYTVLGFWGLLLLGIFGAAFYGKHISLRAALISVIFEAAIWSLISLIVGAPWYIKNLINTGNPVYPFFYNLFGGKFWNSANAAAYAADQAKFGIGKAPLDLLLSPWTVTMPPTNQRFTEYGFALAPAILLFVLAAPFLAKRLSRTSLVLAIFGAGVYSFWFLVMQQTRYLIPALPAFALIAAEALVKGWDERPVARWFGALAVTISVGWGIFMAWTGIALPAMPVVSGQQSPKEYIARRLPGLASAIDYINTNAPKDAKIALFDEVRGFYLERDYAWATPNHAAGFFPWDSYRDAADWTADFKRRGYTYLLVNMPDGEASKDGQRWRELLPEAARQNLIVEDFAARGPAWTVRVFRIR